MRILEQKLADHNVCTTKEIERLQHFIQHLLNELDVVKKQWALQVVELQQVRTEEMKSYQLESEQLREQCLTLQRDVEINLEAYKQHLLTSI